jgi:hypothetical protein
VCLNTPLKTEKWSETFDIDCITLSELLNAFFSIENDSIYIELERESKNEKVRN